jgi:DNA polymerase I-like protein with 3'-5' exonuclease and polymerase domains/uracil-DNA glycosylase
MECPLYGKKEGPVLGDVRPKSPLIAIGEAPGTTEIEHGAVFVGPTGDFFSRALFEGGIPREEVSVVNVLGCRNPPPDDLSTYLEKLNKSHKKAVARAAATGQPPPAPPLSPIEACWPRLMRDIEESEAKHFLAIGARALQAVARHLGVPYGTGADTVGKVSIATIKQQHGSPVEVNGRFVCSSLHPAFAMRERAYTHIVHDNIKRAAQIIYRGRINWDLPEFTFGPSIDTIEEVCRRFVQSGVPITFDIETDSADITSCQVRCVGMGAKLPGDELETVLVVPFRWMDGREYWPSRENRERAERAVRSVLDGSPLIAHNGAFDTAVCQRVGLMSRDAELKPSVMKQWSDCHIESETEFLTEYGWRAFDDVGEARLATINQTTQELEWQLPFDKVDKPFSGEAYVIESQKTRAVVTGNHRMWHQPVRRRAKQNLVGDWEFKSLEDVLCGPDRMNVLRAPLPTTTGEVPADTLAYGKLLGLLVADGSFTWRGDRLRGFSISQIVGGRAEPLLLGLAKEFDLIRRGPVVRAESWRSTPCPEFHWVSENPHLAQQLLGQIGRYSVERRLPATLLTTPYAYRQAVMEGLDAGDGSQYRKARLYKTFSAGLADDVQALAISLGWPCSIHREGKTWVVLMRPDLSNIEQIAPRLTTKVRNAHVTSQHFENDRIVCFSVPNETLVTRSRRKPAFYGNTMIAHHDTDSNDLPHDLGFVVRQFTEAPLWKKDVDHKAAAGVAQDYDLHSYNFRDVLGTARIWPQLENRMALCSTLKQYETDRALAPITREMSRLGVPVDEVYRGLLSLEFNEIVRGLRGEFAEAVGKDINPRSSQQIGTWLYEDQGLTPPMNPQGFEWEEGDDWSTSTPALLKLIDLGVDEQTGRAIDALLKFRAAETIRGRYVDKIKVYYEDDPVLAQAGRAPAVYLPDGTCVLSERPAISVVHPSWKIHVVPTGRWSSEPNCQNWPARAFVSNDVDPDHRDNVTGEMKINPRSGKPWPKRAPTNLRRLVVAPPGHVFVGGDFSQIELRLYAVMAQDQLLLKAFREDLDPHTLNAATLFANKSSEIMTLYAALMKKKKGTEAEQAELKYLRTVAKRFCIAEGQRVLTQRGEVPIEQVERTDLVWDGVEWVAHDGVIFQGTKEVITHDGLTATPDHKVWLVDGRKVHLGYAALLDLRLLEVYYVENDDTQIRAGTTDHDRNRDCPGSQEQLPFASSGGSASAGVGSIGDALWSVGIRGNSLAHQGTTTRACEVCGRGLHNEEGGLLRQSDFRQIDGLSFVRNAQVDAALVGRANERSAAAVPESEQRTLGAVRRSGGRVSVHERPCGGGMGGSESGAAAGAVHRQDRQRWALRTGQSALGNWLREYCESEHDKAESGCCATCRLEIQSVRLADDARSSDESTCGRDVAGGDSSTGREIGCSGRTARQQDCSKVARDEVRVYDILNAGPRRRFTVEGRLASNCFLEVYGGEEGKLYSVMAAERDKATGERVFHNLTEKRVSEWHRRWHENHPETKMWQAQKAREVRDNGYTQAIGDCRRRYFPGGATKKNAPPNHEIQGSAAWIANDSVLRIAEEIPFRSWSSWTGLCLQVHDQIMGLVPVERADEAIKIFEKCMYHEVGGLPIFAEVYATKDWAKQG